MKSLGNARDREEMQARARRLRPDATPGWGKMNAPRMVAHVSDQLKMSLGRIRTKVVYHPARFFPLKQLLVYLLPWPKGVPTLPELQRAPGPWAAEMDELCALIRDFELQSPAEWPRHPLFHHLSRRAWGRLAYRHLDHHFRQFGV